MTDTAPTPADARRPRRWPRWVLFGSLAVNFLLIGFLAVGTARVASWGGPPGFRDLGPGPTALILRDRPDHPVLQAARARHREPLRQAIRAVRAERRALSALLAGEGPVDPDALAEVLEALRAATDTAQTIAHQALMEVAVDLPEEDRMRLLHRHRGP